MKSMTYAIVAAAALALIAAAHAQTPAPAAPAASDELPPAPERDLVAKTCTGCHTAAQFSAQRLSRDEWKAEVTKMIGIGADVPEDKEQLIVDYLAKSFPAAK